MLENPPLFSEHTICTEVNGPVVLLSNTWEKHISVNHPEVAGSLQQVQQTIANPAYVAKSRPGPKQVFASNVVFVSGSAKLRSAKLHVFVESPRHKPMISTAMYAKAYHAEIIWKQADEDVRMSYDESADVLYISKSEPVPAVTDEGEDGLLLRYSVENEEPCGVTVVSFHKLWSGHTGDLAEKVSTFLNISRELAERSLAAVS